MGHTVGGTVGALSKITGTVGKGLAALSMDKNYQRRRKDTARRDGNVQTKLMRNLRGFGMVSCKLFSCMFRLDKLEFSSTFALHLFVK